MGTNIYNLDDSGLVYGQFTQVIETVQRGRYIFNYELGVSEEELETLKDNALNVFLVVTTKMKGNL